MERTPRFFLIVGNPDCGKTLMTQYLASNLGMTYMLLDNRVSTVRELVSSSSKSKDVVYHFKDFEKASEQAKGALLKVSEETPEGMIIVVTVNDRQFMQTLVSRATVIYMQPYGEEELKEYGKMLNLSEQKIHTLVQMGVDTPSKLKDLTKLEQLDELVEVTLDYAEDIIKHKVTNQTVTSVYRIFSHSYKKGETDMVVLFLQFLKNYVLRNMEDPLKVVTLIDTTLVTISNIPTINRQFVLSALFLEIGALK